MSFSAKAYSISVWKKAKVTSNSHISTGKCYYSVPYEYIGETVDLKIGVRTLEIYHNQAKIYEHELIKEQIGKYSTTASHMPPNSNLYGEWNSVRYLNWAKQKGPFVYRVVQLQFESAKVEQQKYRAVHSILKLADAYGNQRLDSACQYGLEHMVCPNYQNLKAILANKQDVNWQTDRAAQKRPSHKYLRGSEYYE